MHKKANLIEEMPGLGLFCDYIFIKTLLKSCLQTISEVKDLHLQVVSVCKSNIKTHFQNV